MLVYLEVVASVAIWWGLFHGMEHLESIEQLCKSSLQCLISTNCISLDRTKPIFLPGIHVLKTPVLVENVNNLTLHGNSSTGH